MPVSARAGAQRFDRGGELPAVALAHQPLELGQRQRAIAREQQALDRCSPGGRGGQRLRQRVTPRLGRPSTARRRPACRRRVTFRRRCSVPPRRLDQARSSSASATDVGGQLRQLDVGRRSRVGPSQSVGGRRRPTCVSGSTLPTQLAQRLTVAHGRLPAAARRASRLARCRSTGAASIAFDGQCRPAVGLARLLTLLIRFLRRVSSGFSRRSSSELVGQYLLGSRRLSRRGLLGQARRDLLGVSSSSRQASPRLARPPPRPRRGLRVSAPSAASSPSSTRRSASPPAVSAAWRAPRSHPGAWVMNSVSPSGDLQHAHHLQPGQLQHRQQRHHHLVAQLQLGQRQVEAVLEPERFRRPPPAGRRAG